MAYREVTMIEVKEVLRLWLRGRPKKAIARSVGIARNTVRSYIAVAIESGLQQAAGEDALTEDALADVLVRLKAREARAKGESWTKCEEQQALIEKLLEDGLRLTKVRKLLERRQVRIPYATLYRFAIDRLGFGESAPTIPVADCEPGEELQVDTGWMGSLEPDFSASAGASARGSSPPFARDTASSIHASERRRRVRSKPARRPGHTLGASSASLFPTTRKRSSRSTMR